MRILGIDPGIAQTGWGVVDFEGQRYRPVSFGVIKTSSKDNLEQRIHFIAGQMASIANQHGIQVVSIEDIFFAKNVASAIGVAKVIGALVHQALQMSLPVKLFTPLQIKQAVTGYGVAEKHQVQEMVRLLLTLDKAPSPDHAADSLAAAICFGANNHMQRMLHP